MSSDAQLSPVLNSEVLDACEAAVGHRFGDRSLLQAALTHSSAARTRLESNERLEFLGDALLGAVVCHRLYELYPSSPEGELTRIKSIVVSRSICARLTRRLRLQDYLAVGKGILAQDRIPKSILAALFEAIVAAIYLDGGFAAVREFVLREVEQEIVNATESLIGVNYKSLLQQQAQREGGAPPSYVVLDEQGPDHSKCFKVSAAIADRRFAAAWGASKKQAEQRAAQNAIAELEGNPAPHPPY